MLLTIIAFIFVLGVLVFVHELGHFSVAKFFKVKVLEFSLGFPPRIFSFKKKETQYSIGSIPIGGYVKMLGEEETSSDPRAYNKQAPGKRLLIGVAGVIMNVILCWFILSIGFVVGMTPIATLPANVPGHIISPKVLVVGTESGSPAQKSGLEANDILIAGQADGKTVQFSSPNDVSSFTASNINKTVELSIERNKKDLTLTVQLSNDKSAPLGVEIADASIVRVPWYLAPWVGLRETFQIIKMTFDFLIGFFAQLFSSGKVSNDVGGPVAIFSLTGLAAHAGFMILLQFIALLSINLALVNILPFPALDGVRALFIILESIFHRKVVKEEIENIIHTIGFAILIILILLVTYRDIMRLIGK